MGAKVATFEQCYNAEKTETLTTVEGKLVTPGIADARIDTVRGSVVVTTVDAKLYGIPADGAPLFGPESYHLHDYGFFYNNFKQNVADRIKSYLSK